MMPRHNWHDPNMMPDFDNPTWVTTEGEHIPVSELTDDHLSNIITYLIREWGYSMCAIYAVDVGGASWPIFPEERIADQWFYIIGQEQFERQQAYVERVFGRS